MIKKTRNQFVAMNLISIALILLIVFGVLLFTTNKNNTSDIENSLNEATARAISGETSGKDNIPDALGQTQAATVPNDRAGNLPPSNSNPPPPSQSETEDSTPLTEGPGSNAPLSKLSFFVIISDNEGNYIDALSDYSSLDLDYEQILTDTINQKDQAGKLSGYSYHYSTTSHNDLIFYAYVDTTILSNNFHSLVITSLLLGIGGLILVFLVSLYLSNWILKPVVRSWDQQKQFIADASHELKTPLTVIMANNKILQSHPNSTIKEQQRWLDSTTEESKDMQQLIADMLFLAKHDQTKQAVVASSFSLSDLLMNCALGFEAIAFQKHIIIETNIDPNITIVGDPIQMKRLFTVFIDNACKYSHSHTTIKISLKKNNSFTFKITNWGKILTEESLSHLFDRFYRSDYSRSREQGGAGLGLSIAKQIANLHHLSLSVTSNQEDGTTFSLRPSK